MRSGRTAPGESSARGSGQEEREGGQEAQRKFFGGVLKKIARRNEDPEDRRVGGGRDLGRGVAKPPAQLPGSWEGLAPSSAASLFKDQGKLFLAAADPLPEKE